MKEDQSLNGEAFWHRSHQVEGMMICAKHHSWLIDSDIPFAERKNKHEFSTLEQNYCFERSSDKYSNMNFNVDYLKLISEQTYYLLNNNIGPLGYENSQKFYITKLQHLGLTTVTGRIKWIDFIPMFNNYFGKKLLSTLGCYIGNDSDHTWLHKLLRKPRVSCHPLRHILLLGFLGETIPSMVSQIGSLKYEPFGSGPWLCLNKAADHYEEPMVNSCVITRDYKTGLPVGTFSCSCGFVYSRSWFSLGF